MGLLPLSAKAMLRGRPFWSLRYYGGRVVEEPECDWLDAPRPGRQAVRLCCPNGEHADFEAEGDGTGKFFQFKSAWITAGGPSGTLAHVVGMVVDTEGRCVCAAWENEGRRLVRFEDNVYDFRYSNVGRLSADHLGLDAK